MAKCSVTYYLTIKRPTYGSRQGAYRRQWLSLAQICNAVLSHLWASLRARRETVIYGVRFLVKGATIFCETCLVADSFSLRLIVK